MDGRWFNGRTLNAAYLGRTETRFTGLNTSPQDATVAFWVSRGRNIISSACYEVVMIWVFVMSFGFSPKQLSFFPILSSNTFLFNTYHSIVPRSLHWLV
jgi:hypothetical protein